MLDVRITNVDALSYTGHQKQSFFPMNVKKRRNTSKPVWSNAATSHPLWYHAMEGLERTPR